MSNEITWQTFDPNLAIASSDGAMRGCLFYGDESSSWQLIRADAPGSAQPVTFDGRPAANLDEAMATVELILREEF
jgi:hypothetical protein